MQGINTASGKTIVGSQHLDISLHNLVQILKQGNLLLHLKLQRGCLFLQVEEETLPLE